MKVEENILNASISRVLSAKSEWQDILQCASNPSMQIVISNTTEVGITLVKDNIHSLPPISFPGKAGDPSGKTPCPRAISSNSAGVILANLRSQAITSVTLRLVSFCLQRPSCLW